MDEGVDAVAGWAASGAMWLTGHPDGPPLSPAAAVIPALEAAAAELSHLSAQVGRRVDLDIPLLLTGRAALRRWHRQGQTSANGTCRLLPTADGWIALNLSRPSDVDLLPALLERPVPATDPWPTVRRAAEQLSREELLARATLLGLPLSGLGEGEEGGPPSPFLIHQSGQPQVRRERVVVDLSGMWAGPVCGQILGWVGMRVTKVESTRRPDGARVGDPVFFDWLHAGQELVALDLEADSGRQALRGLISRADVVIEGSRPRALRQMGIVAEDAIARRAGVTWVSITGYGRDGDAGQRVAFGDDAAVAAGLVAHDDRGRPVFCGDAIADPITGLFAALGALTSIAQGGGHLVDVPMVGAVAATMGCPVTARSAELGPDGDWWVGGQRVERPREPRC